MEQAQWSFAACSLHVSGEVTEYQVTHHDVGEPEGAGSFDKSWSKEQACSISQVA